MLLFNLFNLYKATETLDIRKMPKSLPFIWWWMHTSFFFFFFLKGSRDDWCACCVVEGWVKRNYGFKEKRTRTLCGLSGHVSVLGLQVAMLAIRKQGKTPSYCLCHQNEEQLFSKKNKTIGIYFKKVFKQWVSNHFTVTSESLTLCWYECVLAFLRYSVLKTGLVPHFILHILLIQSTSVCVRPVKKACIMSFPPSLLSPVA